MKDCQLGVSPVNYSDSDSDPGNFGQKPFRHGTPRPKSIFLLGHLGHIDIDIEDLFTVEYNNIQHKPYRTFSLTVHAT